MKFTIKKIAVALFIPLILTAVSCKKKDDEQNILKTKAKEQIPFIKINEEILYQNDFFDFASTVLREMSEESYGNPLIKENLINNFIEHRLLLNEAKKRGMQIDNKKIGSVLESFSTEKGAQDLKVYSGSYETDNNKLAELMRERLLVEALINQTVGNNIKITEKQVKDYYNKNDAALMQDHQAHLLHIFTKNNETAEKAMSELKRGLSFNEVAERYSEGPERNTGGDLGFVSKNDFPEIFSAAFKLKPQQISQIMKSDYGYHIFLVKKFEKPKKMNYDNVKSKIYMELYTKEQENKTKELIDELYKNTKIQQLGDINLRNFPNDR